MKKTSHMHELSAKLQQEIDAIVSTLDDQAVYAEFKEEDIVDIYDDAGHEVIHDVIDERIQVTMHKPVFKSNPSLVSTLTPKKVKNKATLIFRYLFKRFEY